MLVGGNTKEQNVNISLINAKMLKTTENFE